MTQLDTTAPAPAQAPVNTSAPAPAPAPTQSVESQSDWPRYDPARLKAAGYDDYHNLLADGKAMKAIRDTGGIQNLTQLRELAQMHNYPDEASFLEALAAIEAEPPATQQQTQEARQGFPQFDPEEFEKRILDGVEQRFQGIQQKAVQSWQKQQQEVAEQRAQQAKEDYAAKALETMGFKKSGDRDYGWNAKKDIFMSALDDILLDSLPPNATQKDAQAILRSGATEDQLMKAAVALHKQITDDRNIAVSDFATKQESVPSATAGEGPGGSKQTHKPYADMTREERIEFATRHVKD